MARPQLPTSPVPDPRHGTLLQTFPPIEGLTNVDSYEEWYDSYNCMHFDHAAVLCGQNSKDFDLTAAWQSGFFFAVYGGATCKSVGLDRDRQKSEIKRVFLGGESAPVERAFMVERFTAVGPDNADGDPRWDVPIDLTPAGGAVKPLVGQALLEAYAADQYVGLPTLHMPVVIASLLAGISAIELSGDVFNTNLGSKVVAGAGYDYPNLGPDGDPAPVGEKWLYATGEVAVMRGELQVPQEMAHSTNDVFMLAERAYVGAIDCFTAAVRVQVTS